MALTTGGKKVIMWGDGCVKQLYHSNNFTMYISFCMILFILFVVVLGLHCDAQPSHWGGSSRVEHRL